jgi:hypothetical protein
VSPEIATATKQLSMEVVTEGPVFDVVSGVFVPVFVCADMSEYVPVATPNEDAH